MSAVIRVENLGKQYLIQHQKQGSYQTLRDSMAHFGRGLLQRICHPLSPNREVVDQETFWALQDINFEVKQGERIGVIGRNGAGKSTLLKILSRITEPTTGRVTLHGRVASLLEVGTGFHPELTGRENIYLNGAIMGMSRREIKSKFDEIVAFSEVEKFLDTPVKRYSSGMYIRLAFAVAAHLDPEILVVDEVLAVGDQQFQKKCLGKMKDVAEGGRTVLFVSHNMGMIRSLCNKAILLTDGQISRSGNADEIVDYYFSDEKADSEQKNEIHWDDQNTAPGCEDICLSAIRILNCEGRTQSIFTQNTSVQIEITYRVLKPLHGMRIVLHLLTEEGVVAFASTDQHQRANSLQPGLHKSLVTIPEDLLNWRKYFVQIHLGIPNVRTLVPKQTYLAFNCVLDYSNKQLISQNWPGVIAPKLQWIHEQIEMH